MGQVIEIHKYQSGGRVPQSPCREQALLDGRKAGSHEEYVTKTITKSITKSITRLVITSCSMLVKVLGRFL